MCNACVELKPDEPLCDKCFRTPEEYMEKFGKE